MYLQTDVRSFDLSTLGVKFDVILLEPPLEEYQRRASGVTFSWTPWEWEEVRVGSNWESEGLVKVRVVTNWMFANAALGDITEYSVECIIPF